MTHDYTRLKNCLNSTELIPIFQFRFRSNNLALKLFRVMEHICTSFKKHCHTGAVFIDVSKVFEEVWHEGVLHLLKFINIQKYLFYIMHIFLSSRKFSVKVNDTISDLQSISADVPHESKRGPILFNIFITDILQ